ncbi:hypothetical protein [Isorropodon fossajaponicum symbiont]|uniref:hypothetical protein n=1 Tax=Isorropodon fossajaponicum symbiont TaxID=883811 RepID=UPI001916560A|nr:hypothetical protein [Isorropodon fossajaponicum symbiont]
MNKKYTTVLVVLTLTQLSFANSIYDGHGENQHWVSPDFAQQVQNPMASNRRSVNKGEILFINNCASCHGDEADGNGLLAKTLNPKSSDLRAMPGMHLDGDFDLMVVALCQLGRVFLKRWIYGTL